MQNQNMSDIIEAYIKQILNTEEQVEIRRNEMATHFNCVPSQINYVINTRFTEQHGYLVESKRGGGGYIRIMKVKFLEKVDLLNEMIRIVGNSIGERDAYAVVQNLYNQKIISKREGNLILAVMDKAFLQALQENEDAVRAGLLKKLLTSLRYEA
ncbi:CtsR family transcriptional regulator [Jeotgalibaca sp. PTS2502]|uniref:CtsR family transcriptional regulator n=1 Tax=Jeotgalibaca sp. PTS2502 TaxID=1903686 RepID=UPI00097369BB|nr:CtsR family transcriptional regulator [Jeotgalibaca sp. PTS2502]APZ49785.1 CtsR family transcriptional regulator [Jeotgalibaca sp. PTS2502]